MKVEWSNEALADLDRFVEFLDREHPSLAAIVATEIIERCGYYRNIRSSVGRLLAGKNIARSYCRFSARLTCFNIASIARVW